MWRDEASPAPSALGCRPGDDELSITPLDLAVAIPSNVAPRLVIFRGLQVEARRLLLVHNDPSGNADPSREDMAFTPSLHRIGSALDMPVVDHLIVVRGGCVSHDSTGI